MLNESDAVNRSTANGVTTVFPYTFKIYDKSEIEVLSNLTALTVDIDFEVDGIGSDSGGNVTISSAPSNGTIITRLRKQPTTQASNYQSEAFPPERIEKDFDKLAMRLQQVKEMFRRCLTFVKSSSTVDQTIDTPTVGLFARAKVGGGIDWATPAAVNASLPLAVADGGTGATDAAGARANLILSPMPISDGGTGAATAGGAAASLNVLPLTGGTVAGNVVVATAADPRLVVDSTAAGNRRSMIEFRKNGVSKWMLILDQATADAQEFTMYDSQNARAVLTALTDGSIYIPISLRMAGIIDLASTVGGGQIRFPVTQNASADANTLDDYEEGSWTPSLGGTTTYTSRAGRYVKIGRVVHIRGRVTVNVLGTGSTSTITGLPFSVTSVGAIWAAGAVQFTSLAVSPVSLVAVAQESTSSVTFWGLTVAGASMTQQSIFGNAASVHFHLTYETDS